MMSVNARTNQESRGGPSDLAIPSLTKSSTPKYSVHPNGVALANQGNPTRGYVQIALVYPGRRTGHWFYQWIEYQSHLPLAHIALPRYTARMWISSLLAVH
jgi:hypothetical protein